MDDDLIGTPAPDDYPRHQPWEAPTFSVAPAMAVAALVLAFATLSAFGLLSGSTFVPQTAGRDGLNDGRQLAAGLLGAGLALLPVLLGWSAARRAEDDDPSWTEHVGRGAALVGAIAVVLRLIAAITNYVVDEPSFNYL